MKNLTYDNENARCVPYDSPPPGLTAQLHRLVTEERPGACLGCGFEHNCKTSGCAVPRKISRIVAATGKSESNIGNCSEKSSETGQKFARSCIPEKVFCDDCKNADNPEKCLLAGCKEPISTFCSGFESKENANG